MIFWAVILVIVILGTAFLGFILISRHLQQQKNLQRSLSMAVFKIHLPAASEDINATSHGDSRRDERDVVEENISKALALYSLLASTAEKEKFKTRYYGQVHFGFEIIAEDGYINFYTVIPTDLSPVISQAVMSAYRGAKLEEVKEHNLFHDDIDYRSLAGSELALRENFAYPLATYSNTRQDIMKSLLGALAELKPTEGAGLQILIRPAYKDWVKDAKSVAKKVGKNKTGNGLAKDLLLGAIRSPEEKSDKKEEISSLDKRSIESIEDKLSKTGFEVAVRLLVATNNKTRSQSIYRNLLASFTLLDSSQGNGFIPQKNKNMVKFVNDFNLRIFSPTWRHNILNVDELATIFHLPNQDSTPTSQLERQTTKQVDAPRNFLPEGLLLGHNLFRGQRRAIVLGDEDRMRHMYVVGQTGTGKSVFLENLVVQDIQAGKGFALVDPHGETAEKVLSQIPDSRLDDVIYFNPGNMDYPMGLNIFEYDSIDKQDFLIQEAITMLYKLYDPTRQGIIGPRYEHMFRNAAKLIMADPAGGTFIDIPKLFNDARYVRQKLRHVSDQTVIDFWTREMVDTARSSEFGDVKSWFVSKFSAFLSDNMMRNIIGQTKSSFDLRKIMDDRKIMIINLSQGLTGELNMKLLGMLFVTKFQMAAMSRANIPGDQRSDFTLYIDEFQNFATESFANILSAARKYRLALVIANQHTTQLTDEIRDAVYGNVGTAVTFRINAQDAEHMIKQFYSPIFAIDDLTRLPLGHTVVRTLVEGAPTMPFNMNTLKPIPIDHDSRLAVEQRLLSRYGRPRKEVEAAIYKRLEVITDKMPPGMPSTAHKLPPRGMAPPGFIPPGMTDEPNSAKSVATSDLSLSQKEWELQQRLKAKLAQRGPRELQDHNSPPKEDDSKSGS